MKVLDKSNLIFYLVLISIVCFLVFIDFSFVNDFIFYIVFFNITTDVIFKFLIEKFDKSLVVLKTNFILNFLIVYLLFIIFEITILLLNLHHIK